ncbi:HAD family hydrolase [Mumia quercus]|uniref:HAD family hydrolase n=1 Tax=Mumia quercus TaxID=2976125 RepID=UPI0021CF759E|nr:HAD family hydrolase [Mumia quercus]
MTTVSSENPRTQPGQEGRHDRLVPVRDGSLLELAVATVATLTVAVLSMTPSLRFPSWSWVCLALVTVVGALTWPTHRDAIRALRRRDLSFDVLASAGVLAAYLWALYAVAVGHPSSRLVAPVVVACVLLVRQRLVSMAGTLAALRRTPRWLVPALLLAAAGTLAAWLLVADAPWPAVSAAVAVLVAACPGALGVAVPAAVVAGARRGDRDGVTYDDPAALDVALEVDTLVLHGHETVADGMHVTSVDPLSPDHDRNIRWFAGALEHTRKDAVGRAISRLSVRGRVTGVQHHPELGVSGSVDRHPVRVGRPAWIGVDAPEGPGVTVAVEVDARPLGTITVADTPRPASKKAVDALRALGLEPVLVTTRDRASAEQLAAEVGISHVVAETGAIGGRALVDRLHGDGHRVAVLSSSPDDVATICADLALAAPGSGAAVSVAGGDVAGAVAAIRLAHAIDTTAMAGTSLALAYTVVAVPLAAAGVLAVVPAALATAAATLVVVVGSLRLRGRPH